MKKNSDYLEYPDIDKYALTENLSREVLVKGFEVEKHYHQLLKIESNPEKRSLLYDEFYSKLLPIYARDNSKLPGKNPKEKYVKLFKPELKNKSIVDFGCGQGFMLQSIDEGLPVKQLVGIDVYIPTELKKHSKIDFVEANIVNYQPAKHFDVALSDNVIEHLVYDDAKTHLENIYRSLSYKGKLIIIMPNRLFGPWDVTRIKDFSQSGRTPAQGGHVNESTHSEMVKLLQEIGFTKFSTIIPVPKLKYYLFRRIRVSYRWITFIESSPLIMKLIKSIKFKGECILKFPVLLIADK